MNHNVNFKALNVESLRKYISHFGIRTIPTDTRTDLAAACARHFSNWSSRSNPSEEERILENFSVALHRRVKGSNPPVEKEDGRRKRKTTSPIPDDDDEDMEDGGGEVYCLCKGPSYGEMIGCDNNKCKVEWFHMACLGLNKKPTGKWYCPECSSLLNGDLMRGTRSKASSGNGSYSDMISYALNHLPRKQGTLKELCAIIERDFTDNLNWRLEGNSLKRTPMWLTFIERQLHTNPIFVALRGDLYGFAEKY